MGTYPYEVRDWTGDDYHYDEHGQYIYKNAVSRNAEADAEIFGEEEETDENDDNETADGVGTNEPNRNNIDCAVAVDADDRCWGQDCRTLADFYKRKYWLGNI